jgi:catechol 2,3-dioxygenase-like lactoylglutathione lyase family enzyme
MRSIKSLGYAISGSAILALLAGCSGGGTSSSPMPGTPAALLHEPPSRAIDASNRRNADPTSVLLPGVSRVSKPDLSPGFADVDAAAKAAIIISDGGANDIDVFSAKFKLIAKITGVSGSLDATKSGSVYVTVTGTKSVLLYKNDYKTLLATLRDPNEYPVSSSYEETTGIVGVTNVISTSDGPGTVSFYAKGKTTPCVTVGSPAWGRVYFDAFDSKGNLFVDGQDPSGNTLIGEITGGCKAKTITTLKVGNVITFPGGVQVAKNDDLVVDDQSGAMVYTYKPPVRGSLGAPIVTTPLTGASDPVSLVFTSTGKNLWTVDAGLDVLDEYAYPAGGSPIGSISGPPFVAPNSIAFIPVYGP